MFELKSPCCKVWAFVVLGRGKVCCARKNGWLYTRNVAMSGEKKAKGWRFYGLVCLGAIVLLSAGVWALQYAGSVGQKKTLSPLVVHNNLQIDLNEPDLFSRQRL